MLHAHATPMLSSAPPCLAALPHPLKPLAAMMQDASRERRTGWSVASGRRPQSVVGPGPSSKDSARRTCGAGGGH
eukprot:8475629-Alexandrium_andersonii.AAC.1